MPLLARIVSLCRNVTRKDKVERELEDEVGSYLELATQLKMKRGLTETEARREALIDLGGIEQTKEQVREIRLGHRLETQLRDTRFALRFLRKSPGFTLACVVTLALGIGANTAIVSIIDGVVLRPLPYREPNRLVKIWPDKPNTSISKSEYAQIRNATRSFDDIAAYSGWSFTLTGSGEAAKIDGARATASLFSVLGVNAAFGRTFLPDEDQPGHEKVVLLGHDFWQTRFGSDREVIGRPITLDGERYVVVGIMPKGFNFPASTSCDLWMPATIAPQDKEDFNSSYLMLLGRLKSGVSLEQARSEIGAISRTIAERLPSSASDYGAHSQVIGLQTEMVANIRATLFILLGTVALVLLIACANVANLQLARMNNRQQEIAIRAAMGASRGRLIRQLLTESVLLSFLGGVAGVAVAFFCLRLLLALMPSNTPRLQEIAVNGHVLLYSLGLSLFTGVLLGLAPALHAVRPDLQMSLKHGGRTSAHGSSRLRSLLMISEVSLALMLVISAGLLIKSFWRLRQVDPGFQPDHLLSFQLSPPDFAPGGPAAEGAARARVYYRRVLERLAALPGVQSVGGIHLAPMSDSNWNPPLRVADRPPSPGASLENINWRLVTPGYFRTMNIPLLKGRFFVEGDNESDEKVAIVNETLARKYWPNENPIGKRISTAFEGKENWVPVVGVVGDIKQQGLGQQTEPEMYRPYDQHIFLPSMAVMMRTISDPAALAPAVRRAVASIDQNVPISDLQLMSEVVDKSIAQPRSTMLLLAAFAATALALGIIGIYAVISYSAAQRTHEFGVRMALGAQTVDVMKLVIGQGLKLTLLGLGIGVAGALAVTRLLSSLLFGVSTTDPATFAAVTLLLAIVALLACYIPARRATKIVPMAALRCE